MKTLTLDECRAWCAERGLRGSEAGFVGFAEAPLQGAVVALPRIGLEIVGLANSLVESLCPQDSGALLWLREWDIWSQDYEEVGGNLYARLLQAFGQGRTLRDAPGQLFEAAERLDLRSFLTLPLLFQWDAYLIPADAPNLAILCHDGFVSVLTGTAAELERVLQALAPWSPVEEVPARLRRGVG